VYHCPMIESGPGVIIVSGKKYCSCCPVSITYLGMLQASPYRCSWLSSILCPPAWSSCNTTWVI
jgi:hypothetical protein